MKLKSLVFLLFSLTASAVEIQNKMFKSFYYESNRFVYSLILNIDSTFNYSFTDTRRGNTKSQGKWKLKEDTLLLYNFIKPYTILYGQEARIDTLGNKRVVEVCLDNEAIYISNNRMKYYIDGIEISTRTKSNKFKIPRIEVWINSLCNSSIETNDSGKVYFTCDSISEINLAYDTYVVKNMNSNYFKIFLSNFPISVYPKELYWNSWIIQDNFAIPLECGEMVDYLKLKVN